MAFFMNPYQKRLLAESEFLNMDMFTENSTFPYLLNVVAFDYLVLECEYKLIFLYFFLHSLFAYLQVDRITSKQFFIEIFLLLFILTLKSKENR